MCLLAILVVEDEVMIRMLVADTLRDEGYEVVEAANGDEATAVLLSGHQIDLVLTDVRMPGQVDGIQLAMHAKELDPSRPVIVTSGHLPPEAARRMDDFLRKPFSLSTMLGMVTKLIGPSCQTKTQQRTA
ncbi:response regulator [Novosphingobium rosa]|jgi:CheY-like chemotaxis protein|uniref:response regulator n=1 Tax=Novosphingobium rosa TaxID=76978 RepID=UPI000829986C|nr:response regulator [Novosphingobium rosa]